jgi:uncharacterized protein (TIGR02391 family)
MVESLDLFESIVRRASLFTEDPSDSGSNFHPFDSHNIDPHLPSDVKRLFDNGHYAQATFEASKFLENEIVRHSGRTETGKDLMFKAFDPKSSGCIKLNQLSNPTEESEQEGYRFLFAGEVAGIRNPRGHLCSVKDDPDSCLAYLSFISLLLKKLADAGYI